MDISKDYEFQRKLDRVCNYNKDVSKSVIDYFKQFPEYEAVFLERFERLAWSNKHIGSFRNHISLNAVPLAQKIYKELQLVTFPFIKFSPCRGWDTAGGTWSWSMEVYTEQHYRTTIGGTESPKQLLRKCVYLWQLDSGEIGSDKITKQGIDKPAHKGDVLKKGK